MRRSQERTERVTHCQGRVDRYQPRIMGLSWDKGGGMIWVLGWGNGWR